MSNFPNPSTIININTTKTIAAQTPQYLRTFAICSCGDTTLDVGNSLLVSSSSYEDIMNKGVLDNYTKKWLSGFFNNCIGKMALVVECGTSNTTIIYPSLTNLQLQNNLELNVGQELSNSFANNYNYTFGYKDDDNESSKIFSINATEKSFTLTGLKAGIGYLKVVVSGSDISTTYFILQVVVKTPITWEIDDKKFELNVKGDPQEPSDVTSKTYNVNTNAASFSAVITKEGGEPADDTSPSVLVGGKSFIINSGSVEGNFILDITIPATANNMETKLSYAITIVAKGQSIAGEDQTPILNPIITMTTDTSDHEVIKQNEKTSYIDVLDRYISENEKTRAYKYSVPRQMMANEAFLSLIEKYSKIDSSVYFSGETIRNSDPNTDPVFVKLKSRKAFFAVYNNCESIDDILDGGITGIMASNSYDISTSNQMSPLCFKYISFNFKKTTNTLNEILTDCPVTWIGYQAGQKVLFGGRYCDGETWDYWYSWDNVRESVKTNVETFIINAINTLGNNPLRYNNDGIKNISLNLELSLQECVTLGYINQFGESLDIATNTIKNVGKVAFIDFDNYIKSNPDDYAKGIYNGYSAYVQIGRFILQISFNVNIG